MNKLTNKRITELLSGVANIASLSGYDFIGNLCFQETWVSKIDRSYICRVDKDYSKEIIKTLFKYGITDQWQNSSNNKKHTTNIGFNPTENKWYGWSHRAIVGFGIGDKIFDEKWKKATDETPFVKHGGITIKTIKQAKQAAINFAEYIG